jgi:tyrosine-protein kinase Etk/Wzc
MQNSESNTDDASESVTNVSPGSKDEINLLDYLIILLKHKKLILGVTLGAAIITAIICFIIPPTYEAETAILPPQQQSSSMAGQLLSQMGGAGGLTGAVGGALLGVQTPSDLYVGILKSTTVADRIIDRFDLMKLYDADYREDARKELLEDVLDASADKDSGIITITIEDKEPKRAANMANAFVEELKHLTKGLAVTEAAQRRLFFEEQLKDAKTTLTKAEEAMKSFQEKTGVMEVDEQAKAVIEGFAALSAQIAAKEVELKVMKTYSTPNNPDLQKEEEALTGLKAELKKLEVKNKGANDPIIPTVKMPELGTEYARKLRDVTFSETLFELLTKQYEIAKLDEARGVAIIQVIDKALPPTKKAKPNILLLVAAVSCAGFFVSVMLAFLMEYKERASRNPETKEKFETLRKYAVFRSRKKSQKAQVG